MLWLKVPLITLPSSRNSNIFSLNQVAGVLHDAVLLQTVKGSLPKAIVINYTNRQVQDIWHNITKATEASTSAEIKANSLLQYIMSVKFDDGKWRGTSKDFIVHWCKQLQQ